MPASWFANPPRLRLSGPAALVEAVPFLLGFRPCNSVVVIALSVVADGSPRVMASARAGLEPSAVSALEGFARRVAELGADRVVLLAYGDQYPSTEPGDLTWLDGAGADRLACAGAVAATFGRYGLDVVDVLVVSHVEGEPGGDGWRWRSSWCVDLMCCPAEGRFVPTGGVVSAEAVGLGMTALPSRSGIEEELAVDAAVAEQVESALVDQPRTPFLDDDERQLEIGAIQAALDAEVGAQPIDPAVAARFLAALRDVHVRDAVAVALSRRGARDQRQAALRAAQRFWLSLTRAAPSGWAAPPATLLAMTSYRLGDGARANAALDRALADDPTYSLAQIVEQALVLAIPPQELEAIWVRSSRLRSA